MQRTGREEVRFNQFLPVVYLPVSERSKNSFTLAVKTVFIGQMFPRRRRGVVNLSHEVC